MPPQPSPANIAGSLSGHTRDSVRRLLAVNPLWLSLPPEIARRFALQRLDEFNTLLRRGWLLLFILVIGVGGFGWLNFGEGSSPADTRIWWYGITLEGILVSLTIFSLHHPAVLPHYQKIILLMGSVNLAMVLAGTVVIDNPRLANSLSYVAMLVVTVQMMALRLSILVSAFCAVLGIILGMLIALIGWDRMLDWPVVMWSCVSSIVVNIFISAILERQERISFLQGLLLAHESAERERLNAELDRLAHEDALSGLANRRHFDSVLAKEWDRLMRSQQPLTVLYLDVDHFKAYNDTYGHASGDTCLTAIGKVLLDAARRPGDVAARYGGEEFVVLLPATSTSGAEEVAQRIIDDIDALAIPHDSSSVAPHVTVSIGIASVTPSPEWEVDGLLESADQALYDAKHSGRHRFKTAP